MSDFDYTLIQDIGGSIRRVVDTSTGEILLSSSQAGNAGESAEVSSQDTADGRVLLSTTHIRPFVEWTAGAGLLKVSKGEKSERQGGGLRGAINGFSKASRRRLMQTVAKVRKDAELPDFVTLTYPNEFPSPAESKRHLKIFEQRMKRQFPDIGAIWKLEPQQRGAPHYHMLAWGVQTHDLFMFTVNNWYEIAGNGDAKHLFFHVGGFDNKPCVQKVYSLKGVMSYASKYLGKSFEVAGWDEKWTGRFWGMIQKENIPFGQEMIMYVTQKDCHKWMRYQRRFAKLKGKSYPSLTTFTNSADSWVSNILKDKDNG